MRLFLSSYRAGRHNKELLKLLGDVHEVAVITNAKDYKNPRERKIKVEETLDFFRQINVTPTEIDLRPFFSKPGAEKVLDGYKFVWLAGGNVFLLRRALAYSGVDNLLKHRVKDGSLICGGESAGAIIAGPTLKESEMEGVEDSPDFVAKGYEKEIIWDGLRLLGYVPVPHYNADDYAAEIDKYIQRLKNNSIQYKKMTNEQAIIINGNKEEFLK